VWRLVILWALSACSEPTVDEVALGDDTFGNVCARCHGQDGRGGVAAPGALRPRDLTDPAWQASIGDGQIEAIIRTGKPGLNSMPAFQPALSNARIRAVVAKVRRLKTKGMP
jgi:mono/diheme cytochrome c family protein